MNRSTNHCNIVPIILFLVFLSIEYLFYSCHFHFMHYNSFLSFKPQVENFGEHFEESVREMTKWLRREETNKVLEGTNLGSIVGWQQSQLRDIKILRCYYTYMGHG